MRWGEAVFVALELTGREPDGVLARLRNKLIRPKFRLEQASCLGGRYALLKWEGAGEPDWAAIEQICGSYTGRLLLPDGLSPPQESKIKRIIMPGYDNMVLQKTACGIIDRTKMPMYRRVLGFIDMEGAYDFMLDKLLMHFTAAKVYTRNVDVYNKAAVRVMDELGASVILAEDFTALGDCVLVLSPGTVYTDMSPGFRCPVVSCGPFVASGSYRLVSGLVCEPVWEVLAACPIGIRPHDFAGALYEYCGITSTTFLAKVMLFDYQITGLDQAVKAVIHEAGMDSPKFASRSN